MPPEDFTFLMNTEILSAIPEEARGPFLAVLTRVELKAGQRLMSQGDKANRLYVIQHGSCIVSILQGGDLHPVCRLRSGDLVGEMAIFTGETRTAQVDAETDTVLWGVRKMQFNQLCTAFPALREFLTEIVTNRLSGSKLIAEKIIGKYTITDFIGQGGWSIVYRGIHSSLNMPVAIKMLKHNMAMDADFLARFQDEAKIIASLNHDNIVRVYDIEHLYRTVFIIMELLEGVGLDEILDNVPRLPFDRVLDVLIQVSEGLRYAHGKGIVHQDIKPANIFIHKDDRATIVDFGLACPIGSEDEMGWPGTPFYMSPEQIEGDAVDGRADIYSLGIMAFELATGQVPFPDRNMAALFKAHREKSIPDPREQDPSLPEQFSAFVARAAAKDPNLRYPSMADALEDLISLAERTGARRSSRTSQNRRMMSLFLFYRQEHLLELNRCVEKFTRELKGLGADLRVADFKDLK